jgi:SPP1 family predicted phage head-tail adaptor
VQAGRLRKRVRFQRASPSPDIGGGFAVTWGEDLELWGEFFPQRGSEVIEAGRIAEQVTGVLRVRFSDMAANILPGDRVLIDDEAYNIRSSADPDGRRIRLEMVVEKGVAT